MPSASVNCSCGLAYSASRSCSADHSGALPMMTVSMTRNSSKANWSWRKTPIFFGRVIEPLVGSSSPVKIFIKVDLPAPLGPVTAYRRPVMKVQVTFSNSTRGPKRIEMLLTDSITFQLYRIRREYLKALAEETNGPRVANIPNSAGPSRSQCAERVFQRIGYSDWIKCRHGISHRDEENQ